MTRAWLKVRSMKPVLRHIANLWTLMQHPSAEDEWTLEEKLEVMKDAGFDGVCWAGSQELHDGAVRLGLIVKELRPLSRHCRSANSTASGRRPMRR